MANIVRVELQKIILYYGFAPVADPEALKLWQKTLCESLGLKGRILISKHGINGTLGGDMSALKKYVRQTRNTPASRRSISSGQTAPATTFLDFACACALSWWRSMLQMKSKWMPAA